MFFLKKISTFFEYSLIECNIKDCQNEHYDLLLCKNHYELYITNPKIHSIQLNVYKYNFSKLDFKDELTYCIYYFIHYFTTIHVYYIEHFPLESVFLFHSKKILNEETTNYTKEQFINNFNFDENFELQHFKTHFKTPDADKPLKDFIDSEENIGFPKFFMIASFLATIVYILIAAYFPQRFSVSKLYFLISLIFIFSIFWYLNVKSLISVKKIFSQAYQHKLFKEKKNNEIFIQNSLPKINKINNREEIAANQTGFIIASILLIISKIVNNNWEKNFLFIGFILFVGLIFLITTVKIHLTSQYRIITNKTIKNLSKYIVRFNLYDLDKLAGVNELRVFMRSILSYVLINIFVISFFFLIIISKKLNLPTILISVILSLLILFELYNIYRIIKLTMIIKVQFDSEIKNELAILDQSRLTSRFHKAEFINKLKLNLFVDIKMWFNLFKSFSLFLVTYLIYKYDEKIINFLRELYNNV